MLELSLLATDVADGGSATLLKRVRFESETPIQDALNFLKELKTELTAFISDEALLQFIDSAASRNDYQIISAELLSVGINLLLYEVPEGQENADSIQEGTVEYLVIDSKFLEYPFAQKVVVPAGTKLSDVYTNVVNTAGMTDSGFKTGIDTILKKMISDEETIGHIDPYASEWLINMLNKAGISVYSVVDVLSE